MLDGFENLLVPSFGDGLRELDEAGIRLDVRQSIAHGATSTACVLDCGLTLTEQRRFITIACDQARGRIHVSVAPGALPLQQVVELVAHAQDAGASHVNLGCPTAFEPRTDADVVAYVEHVLARTALPVCLVAERFAFPQLHPSGLPLEALERLADHERVVALALSSFDAGLIEECCERFGTRLAVGSPHLGLLPMLVQNFDVRWSGPAPIEGLQSPRNPQVVRFLRLLRQGRMREAMAIYWSLAPALGAHARVSASYAHTGAQHWPLVKYQQWLSGGNGGLTRQPVMRLFQRDMAAIRAGLAAVGVECADEDADFFRGRGGRELAA